MLFLYSVALSEQERDAPQCRETDQCVDDAAECGCLPAEKVRDKVKSEYTDKAPVDAADDGKHQGNSVHDHN